MSIKDALSAQHQPQQQSVHRAGMRERVRKHNTLKQDGPITRAQARQRTLNVEHPRHPPSFMALSSN